MNMLPSFLILMEKIASWEITKLFMIFFLALNLDWTSNTFGNTITLDLSSLGVYV